MHEELTERLMTEKWKGFFCHQSFCQYFFSAGGTDIWPVYA
jgi:hypothetical protein